MVASKCYEVPPPTETTNDAAVNSALMQADAVRMIGIRKKAGEPLVSRESVCVCEDARRLLNNACIQMSAIIGNISPFDSSL